MLENEYRCGDGSERRISGCGSLSAIVRAHGGGRLGGGRLPFLLRVEYTAALCRNLLVLLEFHVDHDSPGKCRSCGNREVCGEGLI